MTVPHNYIHYWYTECIEEKTLPGHPLRSCKALLLMKQIKGKHLMTGSHGRRLLIRLEDFNKGKILNFEYQYGKLLDCWIGSAKLQKKIVDDIIREILPERIQSMIISYDVIERCTEPAASEPDDKTVEEDDKLNLRDEDDTIISKPDD